MIKKQEKKINLSVDQFFKFSKLKRFEEGRNISVIYIKKKKIG